MHISRMITCSHCGRSFAVRANRSTTYCRACRPDRKALARVALYANRGRTTAIVGKRLESIKSTR